MSDIEAIVQEASAALAAATDLGVLDELRVRYLGKKGHITGLLKSLGGLPVEQRPAAGQAINDAKQKVSEQLEERRNLLEAARFMDSNECRTMISAARETAGMNVEEMLNSIDDAVKTFGERAKAKFNRRGEF